MAASLTANFISLNVFGQTPRASYAAKYSAAPFVSVLDLPFSWSLLGAAGYVYEVVVLNIGRLYRLLEKIFHVPSHYSSLFAFVSDYSNRLFPSTNSWWREQLVLDLARVPYPVLSILLYFTIRFIWVC